MSILEDGPLRRILRERQRLIPAQERPEQIIRRWRERGVPQTAIEMALKMADRWLKSMME
jgi:hypothetical protein